MPGITLPTSLRSKLNQLQSRDRILRVQRGVARLIAFGLAGAAVVLLVDALVPLAPSIRIPMVVLWLLSLIFAVWAFLVRPLRRPAPAAQLAASVESSFPRLDERLTTAVELADDAGIANGSPAFIDLLLRETEQKAAGIDFRRAAPSKPPRIAAGIALGIVGLLVAAGLLWPDLLQGLGRRFLSPWDDRPAIEPFSILVTPGDSATARNKSCTIQVVLNPLRSDCSLPEHCTLSLMPESGSTTRLRMTPDTRTGQHVFRIDNPTGDFRYSVSSGPLRTRTYSMRVVDPVELADARVVSRPPAYARSMLSEQTGPHLADIKVLQHSMVTITCRLNRDAVRARLLWTETGRPAVEPRDMLLQPDNRTAEIELPTSASASFRLSFEAEHDVVTETPTYSMSAVADRPPEFAQATGLGESLTEIGASESLPVRIVVADDISIAGADFEYRVNDAASRRIPVAMTGLGTARASGATTFSLAGLVKTGDRFSCRVVVTDNRSLPSLGLEPQTATYPAAGRWCELQVVSQSTGVREREIAARRDAFDQSIRDLISRLERDARAASRVHQEIEDKQPTGDRQKRLEQLAESTDSIRTDTRNLARDAETAGITSLADRANAIANREMRDAVENLRSTAAQTEPQGELVRGAEQAMSSARDQLEALLKANQLAAQQQLDAAQLDQLAEKQDRLADDTKSAKDAESRDRAAEGQKGLAGELDKLGAENKSAESLLRGAEAEQARQLADKARSLAQSERDLDKSIREAARRENQKKLADIADKQAKLAEDAERLAKQSRRAAEAAGTQTVPPDDAKRAAESLKNGEADEGQLQQKRSAEKLDKLANDLQKALDLSRDPKEAARQLSRLQADTRKRTLESSKPNPENRGELLHEQRQLRSAIENLRIGDEQKSARREQTQALEKSKKAIEELEKDRPNTAAELMKQSQQALDKIAEALPGSEQRRKAAQEAVTRLRKTQDELSRQADAATPKELPSLAKKQAEIADQLRRLDAPNQDARRDAASEAAAAAQEDLTNNRASDVAASQSASRRNLERLHEALLGKTPADEKARDLARQQREIADEAARAGGDRDALQKLQPRQEAIARETQSLETTEAPTRQAAAAAATSQANQALRDQPQTADTSKRLEDAAKALENLASQVSGEERPAERAARLARQQKAQSDSPPADAVEARRRANQIAEETRQLRAGGDAAAEKRQAVDALKRAQRTPPGSDESAAANREAAEALNRLAGKLGEASADAVQKPDPKSKPGPNGAVSPEQVQQARDLAKRQAELQQAAEEAGKSATPPADAGARQDELARQSGELGQSLQQDVSGPAANHAKQAEAAMREANENMGTNPVSARDARRRAAESLDKAAEEAARHADQKQNSGGKNSGQPNAGGQSLQRARRQMDRAVDQLQNGQSESASSAMKDIADALKQAANSMRDLQGGQRALSPPNPGGANGPPAAGPDQQPPTLSADVSRELERHNGKRWGELPGELRTRIMQDIKSQYGDDYARIIKLYFDTLAERKP